MSRRGQQFLGPALLASDLIMVTVAWFVAFRLRFYTTLEVPLGIPPIGLYVKLVPFIVGIWLVTASSTGLLRRTGKHKHSLAEAFDVIPAAVIALFGLIAFSYFYEEYRYSRITLLFFAILQPLFVLFGRHAMRALFRIYRLRLEPRRTLLIARGEGIAQALQISEKLGPEKNYITGVLLPGSDDKHEDIQYCRRHSLQVLAEPQDWFEFFRNHPIQSVVIALPHQQYSFVDRQLELLADQVSDIQILPDVARFARLTPGIELIDGIPIISLHESPLSGANVIIKRLIDIFGAALALLILSPVMAVIAVLVAFSSAGPILYRQERMGLDGERFQCLKFRSMPIDAEQSTGAVWAKPGDQRATPLGKFLRRTSLDELPQLINVLLGDMSLVGPRPERPVFVDKFRQEVPGYMLRHKVKTGITGWAQVNGWRGSTSIEKRIECDLFYIQNWSIWLDFKILLMTLDEVLRGRNAY